VTSWTVDPSSDKPPSRQLVEQVLDGLASGRIGAGEKLPSVRGLASAALVNPNTAARAYHDLEQLGVVAGENGRGVFVRSQGPSIATHIRRGETRAAFERALDEAQRAGHAIEELAAIVVGRGRRVG
jgi:GntR family transcriptional regulator